MNTGRYLQTFRRNVVLKSVESPSLLRLPDPECRVSAPLLTS